MKSTKCADTSVRLRRAAPMPKLIILFLLLVWNISSLVTLEAAPPALQNEGQAPPRGKSVTTLLDFLANFPAREERLLSKNDYQSLIKLEAERVTAISELATARLPTEKMEAIGTLVLDPETAQLSGEVTRSDAAGATSLVSWQEGSSSNWTLEDIEPGYFAVQIVYTAPQGTILDQESDENAAATKAPITPSDNVVSFGEITSFVSNPEALLTSTLPPMKSATQNIHTTFLGILAITTNPATVQLRVDATQGDGIMDLATIYLTRTASPPRKTQETQISSAPGLELLRDAHRKEIQTLRQPLEHAYIEQLALLHRSFENDGRKAEAQAIIQETERLKADQIEPLTSELLGGLAIAKTKSNGVPATTMATPAPGNSPADRQGSMAKLLEGCRLIGEPEAGHRFRVNHRGSTLPVQLYFVDCPLIDAPSGNLFTSYFGVAPATIPEVAEMARTFTSDTLRDITFSLRMAGEKSRDGFHFAMVQIPGIGSLQQLLVTEGLARIQSKWAPFMQFEAPFFVTEILEKKEQAAKRAGAGAWQF